MARPSNRAKRRQQIVDGFKEVLSQHGYERATIANIAKQAGLTPGLIHYHFSTKQEILLELVSQLGQKLEARFRKLVGDKEDPEQQLSAFLDAHLALGVGEDQAAVACWVTIGTEALRQPEVRAAYKEQLVKQQERLCLWLKDLRPDEPPEEKAAAILAAIEGCYQLAAAVPEIVPPGFAARAVRDMTRGLMSREQGLSSGNS